MFTKMAFESAAIKTDFSHQFSKSKIVS